MLPRPLDELIRIARQDDWHKILVGSDLRQILGVIQTLQGRERERLAGSIKEWRDRLGRLDMMVVEMVETPGAESLVRKASVAATAITELGRNWIDV